MDPRENRLAQEVIATFAEQNTTFGLNTLMGRILGLLFISDEAQSLDDMAEKLDMSKGPISQVCRRLKDNNLIEKVWVPGDRKDYYKPVNDLFGRLFANQNERLQRNVTSAERFHDRVKNKSKEPDQHLAKRMLEMKEFYSMLESYNQDFLDQWKKERRRIEKD